VTTSDKTSPRMHNALHGLPGIPAHDQAAELNSSDAARRLHHRSRPNRPLRNRPLQNPAAHHRRPPRVLTGWQTWLGRLFGQGQQ
jgi:hypothetical protein